MSGQDAEWSELAELLHKKGGVPEKRAKAVALVYSGYTYDDAADELGIEAKSRRSQIAQHVKRYREQDLTEAQWLVNEGPEV